MNQQNIERELDRLGERFSAIPSMTPRVLEQIRDLPIEPAKTLNNLPLRIWIMRATLGLAASAAVIFTLFSLFSHPSSAWADVLTNINKTHALTFDIVEDSKTQAHVSIKDSRVRADMDSDEVTIMDVATGKVLMLDRHKKQAATMNLASSHFDFYSTLAQFKDGKEQQLPDRVLDGKSLHVYTVTRPLAPGDQPLTLTLWVDPATNLPVQVQDSDSHEHGLMTHFDFNSHLDDTLFDMTAPAGYAMSDMGGISSDQLKAPATQEPANLVLIPTQGIGSLKFRDPPDKVIAVLGQPEKISGSDYQYPSRGLYLMVNPKQGLLIIRTFSRKAVGPFAVNDFPGKTDKGIALGATRASVEAAYGKPSHEQHYDGDAYLTYDDLGLDFQINGDELVSITIKVHR